MSPFSFLGIFSVVYAAILMTISFFVIFSLRKTDSKGLKVFGYVVAAFLWVATVVVLLTGLCSLKGEKHFKRDYRMKASKKCSMGEMGKMGKGMECPMMDMKKGMDEMPKEVE